MPQSCDSLSDSSANVVRWIREVPRGGVESRRALASLRRSLFATVEHQGERGRFRSLQLIGRGGMGVVYRAWDTVLQRAVALKLLRVDRGEQRRRLLKEARAMARVHHENVIELFDIGELNGEPYIAMEHIEGAELGQWVDAAPRSPSEVLAVMRAAGAGLAAAHSQGVLHRDFKPSNILVADCGRVVVADFGLASSGSTRGRDRPGGTPRYMAPEQRAGRKTDEKSDQWTFAATFWETLSRSGGREIPAKPLARGLSRSVSRRVAEALRRATEADPAKRFSSMDHLLASLSPRERGRRYVWAAVGVVGFCVPAASSLAAAQPACRGNDVLGQVWNATRRAEVSEGLGVEWVAVESRLDAWTDAWTRHYAATCEADTIAADEARACLEHRLGDLNALLISWSRNDARAVGSAVSSASKLDPPRVCSNENMQASRFGAVDRAQVAAHDARIAKVRRSLLLGDLAQAEQDAKLALVSAGAVAGLRAEAGVMLGGVELRQGDTQAARSTLEPAYFHAVEADAPAAALSAAISLAGVAHRLVDHEATDRWVGHAHAWLLPADSTDLEIDLTVLEGLVLRERGDYEVARTKLQQAWRLCGEDARHPRAHRILNARGRLEIDLAEYDAAIATFRAAEAALKRALGDEHPTRAIPLLNLGNAALHKEDFETARSAYQEAYEIRRRHLGEEHRETAIAAMNVGLVDRAAGDLETARERVRGAVAVLRRTRGPEHPDTGLALGNLAAIAADLGDLEASIEHNRAAHSIAEAAWGADHPQVAHHLGNLAEVLTDAGRLDEARRLFRRALSISRAQAGEHPPLVAALERGLARASK